MLNIIPKPFKAEELPGKADARGGFAFSSAPWEKDTARFLKNISPAGGAKLSVVTRYYPYSACPHCGEKFDEPM